jgi:hypothetical protein
LTNTLGLPTNFNAFSLNSAFKINPLFSKRAKNFRKAASPMQAQFLQFQNRSELYGFRVVIALQSLAASVFWAFFVWLGGLGAYGARSFAIVMAAVSTIKKTAWSKLIRRTHMYLALFLTPWMVVYALSSFIFNHHALFSGGKPLATFLLLVFTI